MSKLLFENVNGNTFKMLKENTESKPMHEAVVASGLKKVFENAKSKVTYRQVEAVGFGYIKDLTEAKNTAMKEARILAKELNFKENEEAGVFVKENDVEQFPSSGEVERPAQEETDEITIAETITKLCKEAFQKKNWEFTLGKIANEAEKLRKLHEK